ncbi:MAG: pyrroloquinoline quinone biosynthesis peptide chaperone PqqD [Planctomycetia bacterium]|nr:pyrroloquinoline quinone biosynthesis peptide chaperone PqqD [Planctomycetia bacterium]
MKSTSAIRRPLLARHARYRWDALRQQHQIVFPEGVLVLNESGAAITRHCDGRPIGELVAALENQFQDTPLEADVHAFLDRLFEKRLLTDAPEDPHTNPKR